MKSSTADATSPRSSEAGHWGKEVRSDVHVAFEARVSGGIEISLESRWSHALRPITARRSSNRREKFWANLE